MDNGFSRLLKLMELSAKIRQLKSMDDEELNDFFDVLNYQVDAVKTRLVGVENIDIDPENLCDRE
jgi:hypothetical protein